MDWLILAATKPVAPTGLNSLFGSPLIMMILILVFFWIIIIIPQRKQQKQRDNMLKNLQKGNKVITTGGIHGEIVEIDDDDIRLRVADKVEIKVIKSAVGRVKE